MIPRSCGILPEPDQPCTALTVNLGDQDSISLAGILRGSNWGLKAVRTCQEALALSRNGPVPVVLCQAQMPDGNWNTLMERMHELASPPALIVVSRLANERLWVEVLNLGAYDLLMTPFDRTEVFRVLFLAWMASKRDPERIPAGLKKPPVVERIAPSPKLRCASSGR